MIDTYKVEEVDSGMRHENRKVDVLIKVGGKFRVVTCSRAQSYEVTCSHAQLLVVTCSTAEDVKYVR